MQEEIATLSKGEYDGQKKQEIMARQDLFEIQTITYLNIFFPLL